MDEIDDFAAVGKDDSMALDVTQAKLLLSLRFMDEHEIPKKSLEEDFVCQVVMKRINACELPLNIDNRAIAYISVLSKGNPGRAVITLIDILERDIENVTLDTLVGLYPFGHYSEDALCRKIDEHQARKYKWSKIY